MKLKFRQTDLLLMVCLVGDLAEIMLNYVINMAAANVVYKNEKKGEKWHIPGIGNGNQVVKVEPLMISSKTHAGGLLTKNCNTFAC